jgi:murein DD-endopeptidase MepM/ murein hydrolase activator NlpD
MRFHPILKVRRMHHGIDVLVSEGSPVYSTGGGVIREVGRNSGLGNYVKVEHPATGYTTVYAHLSEVPKEIRRGVAVKRGDRIAFSGNTGLSAAPHLHYEVRDAERRSVNPVFFFLPSLTPAQYNTMLADLKQKVSSLD